MPVAATMGVVKLMVNDLEVEVGDSHGALTFVAEVGQGPRLWQLS